jgi:hypothetical protein
MNLQICESWRKYTKMKVVVELQFFYFLHFSYFSLNMINIKYLSNFLYQISKSAHTNMVDLGLHFNILILNSKEFLQKHIYEREKWEFHVLQNW